MALPELALLSSVGQLGDLDGLTDHSAGVPLVAGIVLSNQQVELNQSCCGFYQRTSIRIRVCSLY